MTLEDELFEARKASRFIAGELQECMAERDRLRSVLTRLRDCVRAGAVHMDGSSGGFGVLDRAAFDAVMNDVLWELGK
jgi:hypothetical protein